MNNYCEHCPVAKIGTGAPCLGRTAIPPRPVIRRYCELVDPNHPAHVPGYDASVLEAAARVLPEIEYPSLGRQLMNAAQAAVAFAKSGFKTVDQAEIDRRLAICATCEQYDPEQERCRHPDCGCFMRVKARAQSSTCPRDKWVTEPTPGPSS